MTAVDDVSFSIRTGETLALVGESGSGKTTVGRCILRLVEPTAGTILFDGSDLLTLSASGLRQMRRNMQMVFQDPFSSLNPRMTVDAVLREILQFHQIAEGADATKYIETVLNAVGLTAEARDRYPHQFSGGQRQRIGIARALILQPRFLICDEAVSALDVSVRAQVLNLLREMKDRMRLTMLFISHDMAVVRQMADRVAVMLRGQLVEWAPADEVFCRPKHPYTKLLLDSVPRLHQRRLVSTQVFAVDSVRGCRFFGRCPHAQSICRDEEPAWKQVSGDSWARCHFVPATITNEEELPS